jgi:hypothetical protein
MLSPSEGESKSIFKNPLLYTSAAVLIAALAVGGIFFSRWQQNRAIERRVREKRLAEDRAVVRRMGGSELAIQTFYASPPVIRRGQSTQLCYGVANAKSVTLEPQSNPVWPSYARCVDISPKKSTTYTLTIQDDAGHAKSQTLDVTVR